MECTWRLSISTVCRFSTRTRPQLLQNGEQQRHVADLGDVFNAADPVHQQGGGDDGNGGIFAPLMVTSPISGRPP